MLYVLLGCVGFLFFYLFDLNKIKFIHRIVNLLFPLGLVFLVYATLGIMRDFAPSFGFPLPIRILFGIVAAVSLMMQFYVLFFALPFKKTYWFDGNVQHVIYAGVYGVCRHPGVPCFFFFYLFLWLTTGIHMILWAGLVWTVMDVIHVYVQDRWMFPKTLKDYETYKQYTPFLIPTRHSLRALSISEEGKPL